MNKIGISLPWDYIAGKYETPSAKCLAETAPEPESFLEKLRSDNINYIELRHRHTDMPQDDMKLVLKRIKAADLLFSIHSDNLSYAADFNKEDFLPWAESISEMELFSKEEPVNITLHPISGNAPTQVLEESTIKLIYNMSEEIKKRGLPLKLALENQRKKGQGEIGTSFDSIEKILTDAGLQEIGICWDMGHGAANHYRFDFPLYPEKTFLQKTVHTHIHDLGPDGSTHWPIIEQKAPIEKYILMLLRERYSGILNLELSFERFRAREDSMQLIKKSISKLQSIISSANAVDK